MAMRGGATSLASHISCLRYLHKTHMIPVSHIASRHMCYRSAEFFNPQNYRYAPPKNFGMHIVPPEFVYIVERVAGKYHKTLNSGLHFVNPFSQQIAHVHSLKEHLLPTTTKFDSLDGHTIKMRYVLYMKVVDPLLASYKVKNPFEATLYVLKDKMSSQVLIYNTLNKLLEAQDVISDNIVRGVNAISAEWGVEGLRCDIGEVVFETSGLTLP